MFDINPFFQKKGAKDASGASTKAGGGVEAGSAQKKEEKKKEEVAQSNKEIAGDETNETAADEKKKAGKENQKWSAEAQKDLARDVAPGWGVASEMKQSAAIYINSKKEEIVKQQGSSAYDTDWIQRVRDNKNHAVLVKWDEIRKKHKEAIDRVISPSRDGGAIAPPKRRQST